MEGLVQSGEVDDYAELARLGRVTKARMSQIMGLLQLAPDVQEEVLFLPAATSGRDSVTERQLRAIVAEVDWGRQRGMWKRMVKDHSPLRQSCKADLSLPGAPELLAGQLPPLLDYGVMGTRTYSLGD
jgi:hypothetical protein